MRVLIIRIDHLGDVILTTPLIRSVAKAGHAVEFLSRKATEPAVRHNPNITACWTLEDVAPSFPRGWHQLARWLRDRRYDALLIPHGKPKELLWASASSRTPIRIASWAGLWGRVTFHRCLRSRFRQQTEHVSRVILRCGEALGAKPDGLLPDLVIPAGARDWAREVCQTRFPALSLVGIHPGCAGNTCNLPGAEYGRLASLLAQRPDVALVATGLDSERHLLSQWPAAVLNSPRFWNSMGQLDFFKLAALIECMAVLVVVGTGPLHMASALRVATVSPFCRFEPISASVWGNLGGQGVAVEPPQEFCRSIHRSGLRLCDFRGFITAEKMYDPVSRLLEQEPTQ